MSRNEKKIAIWDSLRKDKYKGWEGCQGIECNQCIFNDEKKDDVCFLSSEGNIDKAIEIIDNYELPIKEYTLEELENLPKGTIIEVSHDGETWFEREFVAFHKGKIITMDIHTNTGGYWSARPIQEVK